MNLDPDWSGRSGDAWALHWRETDRALQALGAELDRTIEDAAPARPFRGLDIGSGPGSTALALAAARPDAKVIGCDLSASLVDIAQGRAAQVSNLEFRLGDAEQVAAQDGPFDLIFSRHGVMFFSDPAMAFARLRQAASASARLVFSCFQDWQANPWASQLAAAASGRAHPPPGREPSGFAFAEVEYVAGLLGTAGWTKLNHRSVEFPYVAGEGPQAARQAMAFLSSIGPASQIVNDIEDDERAAAFARMEQLIASYHQGERIAFPAAAWIWTADAGA
jgi:SAM-dependent methyltransferase